MTGRICQAGVLLLLLASLVACVDGSIEGNADAGAGCDGGMYRCLLNTVQVCQNGKYLQKEVCYSQQVCSATLGRCAGCDPGTNVCQGNDVYSCATAGTVGALIKSCGQLSCSGGGCVDACAQARASRSYVGCDYWATVTPNSVAADFSLGLVVANSREQPAIVTVSTASKAGLKKVTVAARSVAAIKLPWVDALKQDEDSGKSVLVKGGAYYLQSSQPVSVYQFNPLNYMLSYNCVKGTDYDTTDDKCYSYTNDASLLLPEHVLQNEYMVITRPTHASKPLNGSLSTAPGFFAVVAQGKGETKVSVTFSASTEAGAGALKAYKKGQTATFSLSRFSVLLMLSELPSTCNVIKTGFSTKFCDLSKETDLTGTVVKADQPVALFAGHQCTYVPFTVAACDHLEEQMFPVKTWGKRYLATHTRGTDKDPSMFRVVSAEDNNTVTFNPAVRKPVTLQRGQFVEFVSTADFLVQGSKRTALAQFMVGQGYNTSFPGAGAPRDPAMSLAVPIEQYRKSYRFLAPSTYKSNYVNVIAPTKAVVRLDGKAIPLSEYRDIGKTGYKVARLKISGGAHTIESNLAVGLSVYGVGSYTSYMYPGGLDLKTLY